MALSGLSSGLIQNIYFNVLLSLEMRFIRRVCVFRVLESSRITRVVRVLAGCFVPLDFGVDGLLLGSCLLWYGGLGIYWFYGVFGLMELN